MLFHLAIFALYFVCTIVNINANPECETSTNLRTRLFCSYDSDYLPVEDHGSSVHVDLHLIPMELKFDDYSNVIRVKVYADMSWIDHHLQWNPSDFNGQIKAFAKSDEIWRPNLAVINHDIHHFELDICDTVQCTIEANGTVWCPFRCSMAATCHGTYLYWPHDRHVCTITLGNWMNTNAGVDFDVHVLSLVPETENEKWFLLQTEALHEKHNGSSPKIELTFTLERSDDANALVMMSPCVVFMVINFLTLWMTPECKERLAMILVNLYLQLLFLQRVIWTSNCKGDERPLILIVYEVSFWLTVVLQVNAVVSRGLRQLNVLPPQWLRSVCDIGVVQSYLQRDYLVGTTQHSILAKQSTESELKSAWDPIVKLIDRLIFVGSGLIYSVLATLLVLVLIH